MQTKRNSLVTCKKGDHKNKPRNAPYSPNENRNSFPVAKTFASSCAIDTSAKGRVRRFISNEISFIMILLAAQTIAEMGILDNFLSTELMSDAYRFHGRPSPKGEEDDFASSYSSYSNGKCPAYVTDLSEGVSSSNSNTDEGKSEEEEEDDEEFMKKTVLSYISLRALNKQRFNKDKDVWNNVMSFLPWQTVLQVRGVSKFHFHQSLAFAAVMRLPNAATPAVFIPCREELDACEAEVEATFQSMKPEPWQCSNCGLFNQKGGAQSCSNYNCKSPRTHHGLRMFMGQLRRDGTVPMISWLMREVVQIPREDLLMVENHRNLHTGRGKGCAWPTVREDSGSAQKLLSYHHRLFYDTLNGVEGVWWVPNTQEAIQSLDREALSRNGMASHLKHMPRGAMVVELPVASGPSTAAATALSPKAKTAVLPHHPGSERGAKPPSYHSRHRYSEHADAETRANPYYYDEETYMHADYDGYYGEETAMGDCGAYSQYPCYSPYGYIMEAADRWRHDPYFPVNLE